MRLFKPKNTKKQVYLDHAATTPIDSQVLAAMKPYFSELYFNPSALYQGATEIKKKLREARETVAKEFFAHPDNIIFTSGGTESCNLAILGLTKKLENQPSADHPKGGKKAKKHIITTKIEHHAVLEPIKKLEKEGWEVTYLNVDKNGLININDFKKALRPETVLVSIMFANNEIGSIQPINDIGKEVLKFRKKNKSAFPFFHTDACQATNYLNLNVEKTHVDLMSINGSKIYAPKGVGVLYKRRGVELESLNYGGGQEFGLRPGTENVPEIIGLTKAIALNSKQLTISSKIEELRNYFWKELKREIKSVKLNGPEFGENRLPNNLNVVFDNIDAEELILRLSEFGIMCSSGSACTTDSDEVSHVLLACGLSEKEAKQSIRFTLGKSNTKKEIDYTVKKIKEVINLTKTKTTQKR